jgi:hypothetical protein
MSRIAFALLLSVVAGSAQAGVVFTPAEGPTCRDYSKPMFGHRVCPGPGNYVMGFTDEGNIAGVSIGPRSRAPYKLDVVSQFRGAGRVFGPRVEWHTDNGKPRAAILRIWRISTIPSDREKEVQELEVFAINGVISCTFATVEATQPNANSKAAAFAEEAMLHHCIER